MEMKQPNIQLDILDQQLAANLRGDFNEGWRLSQLLERERPNDDRALFNRGWHYMHQGNLHKGFEAFEGGRRQKVFGVPNLPTTIARYTGIENLTGKKLLFYSEGGFGDEILNVRFAKLFTEKGAFVTVACHRGLVSLFKRVEGMSDVIAIDEIEPHEYDFYVPAMSAALPLRLSYHTLPPAPYLKADEQMIRNWAPLIKGPGLKVGIRWSGNPRFEHEQHRRFPAEPLIALSELPGVTIYSLQRDDDLRDLPNNVIDLGPLLTTWEDTAAVMTHLDLIITSDTATNHLSGALGKETWTVVPILPYYPWALPGDKTPWYSKTKLFRQSTFGDWQEPLSRLRTELSAKVGNVLATNTASNLQPVVPTAIPSAPAKKMILPGMVLAPRPPEHSRGNAPVLHFVSGLPRCGSTVLMSLMAQNPAIYSAPISGLCNMFTGIYANWDRSEFHQELPNPEAKIRTLKALLENYHQTDKPVLLDKDRQWVSVVPQLEAVLQRPVKMIVLVRPFVEILTSFEVLRRRTPLTITSADAALGPQSTIASRAEYFAGSGGPLGVAYTGLKDAVTTGYLDRMLFVDYNKLTNAPKSQLKRIYEFLEEPYFEHELNEVRQIAHGDSSVHLFTGLHDIRPVFKKESFSPREVLGADIVGRYDAPEPWQAWT
jgi:hypothetical protein